tara:strand:- start:392 stop:1393 length:1002 start_codon:yes stop_codon:yes gene_type:complete
MGIKSLSKTINKYSPEAVHNENLYKLSGKKVAVDASLVIYQQLLKCPKGQLFKTKDGKITNHITGLFYKIMNYISLNIKLIFIFDGKPPNNKQLCINSRKEKTQKAIDNFEKSTDSDEKKRLEKYTVRITKEIIDDVKTLLNFMGVPYIHPAEGEGEAFASELCRVGYVDYVLTEDMDTMAYACPKLIRNCVDKSLKRKDIVSIFDYQKMIDGLELSHEQFLDFCILCGCDYCPVVPKIGNITAMKLIKNYKTIENIIENTSSKYTFPENYLKMVNDAKINFNIFKDKINIDSLNLNTSEINIEGLKNYLINDIEMNEKRVVTTLKKYHNNYK